MRRYTRIKPENPDLLYFTADLHLFHENVIKFCNRPFADAQEMEEALIANWNSAVPEDGSVFVLGDMFWKAGDIGACRAIMERLNGRKWLVAGNHDLAPRDWYLSLGFEDARDYMEFDVGGQIVVCCHYPLLSWNGFNHGSWHLHGHAHGQGSHFSARVKDVGVDANAYRPVSWRRIEAELAGGMELDAKAMRTRAHRPYEF